MPRKSAYRKFREEGKKRLEFWGDQDDQQDVKWLCEFWGCEEAEAIRRSVRHATNQLSKQTEQKEGQK
jgi:hypothetical protein